MTSPAGRRLFCIFDARSHSRRAGVHCASSVIYSPAYGFKENNARIAAKLISESSASADKKFAALAEDISDIKATMATKDDIAHLEGRLDKLDAKIDRVETNLPAKIDRLDTKLTKFEEHEIDKRLQLEVRVTTIEKHLALDKKIAA